MLCEMCNSKEACCRALVEGAELSVCRGCGRFGRVLKEIKIEIPARKARQAAVAKPQTVLKKEKEIIETIVADFSQRIRKARERLGLTQDEFARKISERESVVHKLETGAMEPDIEMARKLERLLKIKLVEQRESGSEEGIAEQPRGSGGGLTLGDYLKKRQ